MTQEIDTIADTLNEIIERAEKVLIDLGYTVPASIQVDNRRLGYMKHHKEWRLVWIEEGSEPLPVLNSSRKLRLEAARAFPVLYQALQETHQELSDEAREVTERFDIYIGGLEEQAARGEGVG